MVDGDKSKNLTKAHVRKRSIRDYMISRLLHHHPMEKRRETKKILQEGRWE